jgi:hypothetical protein
MKRILSVLSLLAVAALATGCAAWSRVPAKEQRFASGFYLTPQVEWSARRAGSSENWTIHGLALENVFLAKAIADGKPLVKAASRKVQLPLFRKTMTPSEVVDLTAETFRREGAGDVKVVVVRPEPFGGKPGFRAELATKAQNGLEGTALVAGAVVKDKLYVFVFSAPNIHYFEANKGTIEKVIASARFE